MPEDVFAENTVEEPQKRVKKSGYQGKAISRKKAQRIFHEKLPEAAQFIADLLSKKSTKANPITSDEMKLLLMQKDAADSIVAYGLGRPGTQAAPKALDKKIPLLELDLGDIETLKKENAGSSENDAL